LLKPVSRDTLTKQAAEALKRFILQENLEAGAQLPSERELSEILAVSRNIIREALSALTAESLVVKQAGKGTFVSDFDRSQVMATLSLTVGQMSPSLQALREARAALEIGAVGLMVQRITDEEIEALAQILEAYEQKWREGKSTVKEDIDFHITLLKATKNDFIVEMAPLVMKVFRQSLAENPLALWHNPERVLVEHRHILEALKQRDITAAREAMHLHFGLQDFPV
jgi:GntR family transcriptional repressor for pyruvate dehydrogenase complex